MCSRSRCGAPFHPKSPPISPRFPPSSGPTAPQCQHGANLFLPVLREPETSHLPSPLLRQVSEAAPGPPGARLTWTSLPALPASRPPCLPSFSSSGPGRGGGVGGPPDSASPLFVSPQPGHAEQKGAGKPNMLRGRNSAASADEQPHIGNYRLLKTIGKGNFAKVKLARHVLTGKEVSSTASWAGTAPLLPGRDPRPELGLSCG